MSKPSNKKREPEAEPGEVVGEGVEVGGEIPQGVGPVSGEEGDGLIGDEGHDEGGHRGYVAFVAPTAEELAPLFPNLEIHEVIAAGGMGAVYRVRQPQLDRFVALKILPPESGKESEYVERFGREAKLMAQLNHPNIVGIYDFGSVGNLFYFIMEFVDGQTLHEAIQAAPVPANAARLLMLQIAKGLKYAHDKGVLHLDIKPGNIMVNAEGVVKILDFGLANLVGQDDEEAFGTPYYTAPERYTEGASYDHRADIFSLGAVFYEMLTQSPPQGAYRAASQVSGSPPAYDAIINRCLQLDPGRRYPDAGALGADLAKVKNAPAQLTKTGAVKASATGAGADYQRVLEESRKRKAVVTTLVSVLVGIGLIVGIVLMLSGGGDEVADPDSGADPGGGSVTVQPPPPPDPPDPPDTGGEDPPSGRMQVTVDASPKSETRLRADASLDSSDAPPVAGRTVEVDALIETGPRDGVLVEQGGGELGYCLYLENGYLHFAVRRSETDVTALRAPDEIDDEIVAVGAKLDASGAMSIMVNGKVVAQGSAGTPLPRQPNGGLLVGKSGSDPVGDIEENWSYEGHIQEVVIRTAPPTRGGGGPFDGPFDR